MIATQFVSYSLLIFRWHLFPFIKIDAKFPEGRIYILRIRTWLFFIKTYKLRIQSLVGKQIQIFLTFIGKWWIMQLKSSKSLLKGQLTLKFSFLVSSFRPMYQRIFLRISALAFKKRSNGKKSLMKWFLQNKNKK